MPKASILFDSDFLVAAFTRYRRQHRGRLLIAGIKIIGAVVFVAAATILFWAGKPFEAFLAVLFVGLIVASNSLNRWQVKRGMAKSPFRNDQLTIQLDEKGFHAFSSKQDVKLSWEVFTRVAHFSDGFLLFQGPKMFNWIPFSSLDSCDIAELDALLRRKVQEHKIVEQAAT